MAYKIGSNTIISNTGGIVHSSFETQNSNTSATEIFVTASDGAAYDYFASPVVGHGKIIIGADGVDTTGSGSGSDTGGAIYIFDRNGSQLIKVKPSDLLNYSNFGYIAALGVRNHRIVASTLASADYGFSGYVYVFDLDGNQLNKFRHSDPSGSDRFGEVCAVGCGRIVVGAWGSNPITTQSGAAYIFDLNGTQIAKIYPSDGAADDRFGGSVAIGDGLIVVGAYGDDDNGSWSGSAYIFDLYGNQLAKIKPSDGATNDYFGSRNIAIGCGRIVVEALGIRRFYIFDYHGKQIAKSSFLHLNSARPFAVSDGIIAVARSRTPEGPVVDLLDLDGNLISYFEVGSNYSNENIAIGENIIVSCAPTYSNTYTHAGAAYIYKIPEDHNIYFGKIINT